MKYNILAAISGLRQWLRTARCYMIHSFYAWEDEKYGDKTCSKCGERWVSHEIGDGSWLVAVLVVLIIVLCMFIAAAARS